MTDNEEKKKKDDLQQRSVDRYEMGTFWVYNLSHLSMYEVSPLYKMCVHDEVRKYGIKGLLTAEAAFGICSLAEDLGKPKRLSLLQQRFYH